VARRGTFGRIPRAAPDLTNTLVALIREAAGQEDQNMVDAWKSGGKVDGKGVDDKRLLEHFKMRRDQLDPNDPLWDQWNNRYVQYDFAINESKMSLKYDQKKISEAQMGAFYKKWAGRPEIQQDSEFYRHLLSQAAKWNAAANQGRSAGNARAKAEAHNKWVAATYKSKVQGSETANVWLLEIAKAYGAAPPGATSLDDVYENTAQWHKVMDVIADGKVDDPAIQGMIDAATNAIRQSDPGFVWSESNLRGLADKADAGTKALIDHAMNKTEANTWEDRRAKGRYEATRIKATGASERIDLAADDWANKLDSCNGDPYCARQATIDYRNRLTKEVGSFIVGAGGGIDIQTANAKQTGMLVNTIRTLGDVINGKQVQATGVAALGKSPNTNVDYTQIDKMLGASEPGNYIGNVGNLFNQTIATLDRGGWVSSEPALDANNQPQFDGDGNPIYNFTAHEPTELPAPGLVEIKGITQFTDTAHPVAATGPEGPSAKTVTPVQYVHTAAPTVITIDAGGNIVTDASPTGVPAGGVGGKTPALGYTVLTGVVGPDGTSRTMYRTGTDASNYMYHSTPPVAAGQNVTMRKDPRTGVMTPVLTTTVGKDEKGNPVNTYDVSPILTGVNLARQPSASGNLPLGTFKTPGASATAQAIEAVFAKGQPDAVKTANALLQTYQNGVQALDAKDPTRVNSVQDFNQLNATITLHAQGWTGQSLDDQYKTMNNLSPVQSAYQQALANKGFTADRYGAEEVQRRASLLEQTDLAEQRLSSRYALPSWMGSMATSPDEAMRQGLAQGDLAAIAKAKQDIMNPMLSVSSIKIPGFNPMMQAETPAERAAREAQFPGLAAAGRLPTPLPGQFAPPTLNPNAPPPSPGFATGPGSPGPTPPAPVTTGMTPSVTTPPPPVAPGVPVPPNGYIPAAGAGYVAPPVPVPKPPPDDLYDFKFKP
jgi:hypothetical protein